MATLLIVEDDYKTNDAICEYLKPTGHSLIPAYDGSEALQLFRQNHIDLVVLDIMLPHVSGLSVLNEIRRTSTTPVLMLTAIEDEYTQVMSFDEQADDYMTKPFNMLELKARIKNIFRRLDNAKGKANLTVAKVDDMTVDFISRSVTIAGREVNLTAKEFDLLQLFISNKGVVFEREKLLELIWKQKGDLRTVDVHIRRLREKIEEEPAHPQYILTKWGVGYYFSNK